METRPKIQPVLSQLDKYVETAGHVFLLLMWGVAIFTYCTMPAVIPIHFNMKGEADNYGSSLTILLLPVIGTIVYFGIAWLNRHPQIFNYPTKITADNAVKQYTLATRALRYLKLGIVILFIAIIVVTCLTVHGLTKGPGFWFLPFMFVILLLPMIILVARSYKTG